MSPNEIRQGATYGDGRGNVRRVVNIKCAGGDAYSDMIYYTNVAVKGRNDRSRVGGNGSIKRKNFSQWARIILKEGET